VFCRVISKSQLGSVHLKKGSIRISQNANSTNTPLHKACRQLIPVQLRFAICTSLWSWPTGWSLLSLKFSGSRHRQLSKKDGMEMHRVASDRSWPCRVIGWGNGFRSLGVGVGNVCSLQGGSFSGFDRNTGIGEGFRRGQCLLPSPGKSMIGQIPPTATVRRHWKVRAWHGPYKPSTSFQPSSDEWG